MDIEHKHFSFRELKLAASDTAKTFSGYLAAYSNVDQGYDIFEPGAFKASLSEIKSSDEWPPMLLNHGGWDMSPEDLLPIGVYTDLDEDDYGLKFKGLLAETERGQDIHVLLKMKPRPAIKGMSVGYVAQQYQYETDPANPRKEIRRIYQAKLIEGSVVTFPMNKLATVRDVKSAAGAYEKRKIEAVLRDVCGFTQQEAKAFMAKGFDALSDHREGDGELGEIAALLSRNIQLITL